MLVLISREIATTHQQHNLFVWLFFFNSCEQMLQEPNVGLKLKPDQVQELWKLFSQSQLASLEFHQFVPFARLLILMIYINQYPSEVSDGRSHLKYNVKDQGRERQESQTL